MYAISHFSSARGPSGIQDQGWSERECRAGKPLSKKDVARTIEDDAIGDSVAVQVGQERRVTLTNSAGGGNRLKSAVAFTQEHAGRTVEVTDGYKVGPAVFVDVRHDGSDR